MSSAPAIACIRMSACPTACMGCDTVVRVPVLLRVWHHLQEWRRHLYVSRGPQGELPANQVTRALLPDTGPARPNLLSGMPMVCEHTTTATCKPVESC